MIYCFQTRTFQALQLPFATIPCIAFSSSPQIMGEFVNGFANKVVAILLSVVVIGINIFFVITRVQEAELSAGWIALIGKKGFFRVEKHYQTPVALFSDICNPVHNLQHLSGDPYDVLDGEHSSDTVFLRSKIRPQELWRAAGRL